MVAANRSRRLFLLLLGALLWQRLVELGRSRRNAAALLTAGGREHAATHYQTMKMMHGAWFAAMVTEVWLGKRRLRPRLAAGASLALLVGQALRYAAMHALGERWTTRIITLPGAKPVSSGIYRHIRHPNYLGVVLELASVPLIHSAYVTAALFSCANALLLRTRILAEEAALGADNAYERVLGQRARFLPGR